MKIINNEAVDFIFAAKRFADRDKPIDPDYPGLLEIEAWCREYEKKLSPFLLNDISLLIEKMIFPSLFLFFHTIKNDLRTGKELLNSLEKIKIDDFISSFKELWPAIAEEPLTYENLLKATTDDGLHPNHDPELETSLLLDFFREPGDFLRRLHFCYSEFYRKAYLPGSNELSELAKKKYEWNQKTLNAGLKEYLTGIGLLRLSEEMADGEEPVLYFSLFEDFDMMVSWTSRILVIGGAADQRIRSQSARDKANIFFSCLGDPKRLEIMRLTSVRPWYSSELAKYFDVKPATLSYHMNKLVTANLIVLIKGDNRRLYYRANSEVIKEYLSFCGQDLIGLDN